MPSTASNRFFAQVLLLLVEAMQRGDLEGARRRLEASYGWNRERGDEDQTASVGVLLAQVYSALGRTADADQLAVRGDASGGTLTLTGSRMCVSQ